VALLTLQGVGFDYGRQTVLEAANLTIHPGERYGLVGLNGAGKSTLLRLLAGEMQPLRGKVERGGRVSIGNLPQDTELNSPEPLREAVRRAAFGELLDAEQRLVELSERMGEGDSNPSLMEEYGRLHELFESADGYSI
jgi:ATP-binding cassette subfamily F protein 3